MPSQDVVRLPELIAALSRADAYPHYADAIEVHQTHISAVFLAGQFAYKIKKPVDLGFVDFSTLEKRRHFCDEEVRLNRRLAPNVYLGVLPITRGAGGLQVGGDGVAIEWAVQMQRLPGEATLESRLSRNEVSPSQIRALAQRVATFHRDADRNDRIASFGRFEVIARNARENFEQCVGHVGQSVSASVFERVSTLTESHLVRLQDVMEARAARGAPCDTHGDLRADHVYLTSPNDLVVIDCIEFADRFRFADPVADMAFLTMDLAFHGRRDLARAFADDYFEAADDEEGRALLHFYVAYRAVVRAKVESVKSAEKEVDEAERRTTLQQARAHWLLALGEVEEPMRRPALFLVAGLPGAGKSTLAKALGEHGSFEILRSDVVRKELAGDSDDIYTPAWTERTYGELLSRAEVALEEGGRVIIDANFRSDVWRRRFLALARRWCVPILFLHCKADARVIRQRLDARRHDASDADWRVRQELEATWELRWTPLFGQKKAIP